MGKQIQPDKFISTISEKLLSKYVISTRKCIDMEHSHEYHLLGKGKEGRVYLCISNKDFQKYAVKIIKKEIIQNNKKFKTQLDIAASLNHKHITKVYEYISDDKYYYIIMEYAPYGDLLEMLVTVQLTKKQIKTYFMQIVSAIEYLHGKGIVHRDIKFDNILVFNKKTIKLTDFGFTKYVIDGETYSNNEKNKDNNTTKLTQSHTMCGTPEYACQKILKGVDYKPIESDMWSLGVILYGLIVGRFPWKGESVHERAYHASRCSIEFPKNFPQEYMEIITGLLNSENQISIEAIKKHKLFSNFVVENNPDSVIYKERYIDTFIISKMEQMGLNVNEALISIYNGENSIYTTVYHKIVQEMKQLAEPRQVALTTNTRSTTLPELMPNNEEDIEIIKFRTPQPRKKRIGRTRKSKGSNFV